MSSEWRSSVFGIVFKCIGIRKSATIELYLAGCDDELVKVVTGHSGVEMLKNMVGRSQREPAKRSRGKKPNGTKQDRNMKDATLVSKMAVKENGNDASH